jgi:hypothetical protein
MSNAITQALVTLVEFYAFFSYWVFYFIPTILGIKSSKQANAFRRNRRLRS